MSTVTVPKYSSGAHDTSSRSTGLSRTKCWITTRGIAQPHRRYRGLRTVCGDYDICAIIELNHLEPVFFSHPYAKTPICAETPICAKTSMITVVYTFFSSFFLSLVSLIADGPHHYDPACGHKGSSHLSPVHALQFFIAMQIQHSYNSSTND